MNLNRSGRRCQDQPATKTHIHTKDSPMYPRTASTRADDSCAIIPAKPFRERVPGGVVCMMDQKSGRAIRIRKNFHHLNLHRDRLLLKHQARKEFTSSHTAIPTNFCRAFDIERPRKDASVANLPYLRDLQRYVPPSKFCRSLSH